MALNDDKKKETAEAVNDKKDQAVSEINKTNEKASDKTRDLAQINNYACQQHMSLNHVYKYDY